MRPHQYVKNTFIILPAFFAFKLKDVHLMLQTLVAFIAFSVMASAVYILNDYFDREDDRKHPDKKNRPLASGKVSPREAFVLMGILISIGVAIFASLNWYALWIMLAYFGMNLAYTLKLKHIAVIDICIISIGFVMRLYIGAAIGGIELSMWINLMSFLLAMFLGLAKRRTDVLLAEESIKTRKSIDGYNLEFINGAMIMMASAVVISYIFYTISPDIQEKYHSKYLYGTVFFVLLGILRYMQITFVEQKSGNPSSILLKDRFLQLTILGFILAFFILIYW
jgi:4-hydroxybenzoate polyprenyltransferase